MPNAAIQFAPIQILDIPQNSPLRNPRRAPSHIDIEGYGTLPITLMTQNLWSSEFKEMKLSVPRRVLYTRPIEAPALPPPVPDSLKPQQSILTIGVSAMLLSAALCCATMLTGHFIVAAIALAVAIIFAISNGWQAALFTLEAQRVQIYS